jgi:hypothetical protein
MRLLEIKDGGISLIGDLTDSDVLRYPYGKALSDGEGFVYSI